MVPRASEPPTHDGSRATALASLFHAWRIALTRLISGARRLGGGGAAATRTALRTVARLILGNALLGDMPAASAGRAAATALSLGTVLAAVAHSGTAQSVGSALLGAMWVIARLVVMRLQAPASRVLPREATVSWASGALFFVVAVSPAMRAAAWCAGALTSYRTLQRGGVAPRRAARLVAWGYGFEAAGVVAVWLLRAVALAAFFAS